MSDIEQLSGSELREFLFGARQQQQEEQREEEQSRFTPEMDLVTDYLEGFLSHAIRDTGIDELTNAGVLGAGAMLSLSHADPVVFEALVQVVDQNRSKQVAKAIQNLARGLRLLLNVPS